MERLFYEYDCIESIYFKKFNRNNINNISFMFSGCSSLKELNISNFNTNKVTNMSWMFNKCSNELRKKIRNENKNLKEEAFF